MPLQVIVWLASRGSLIGVLLARTSFGRQVYGLGINERATVFSGVNALKVKVDGLRAVRASSRRSPP